MNYKTAVGAQFGAAVETNPALDLGEMGIGCLYHVECIRPDGTLRWAEEFHNIVVGQGVNHILETYFNGVTYTASHYVGLKDTGAVVTADTMASHGGWVELSAIYSELDRPSFGATAVTSGVTDNVGEVAAFSIVSADTIFGAFLTDINSKGGATGNLFGAGDFASSRAVLMANRPRTEKPNPYRRRHYYREG